MAERIVSPGVFTREKDLSFLPQGIEAIGAAFVGPTVKGPAFVPTLISNWQEFEDVFGTTDKRFYTPYAVEQYLRSAGTVTVIRVLGIGGYSNDYVAINISSSLGTNTAAVLAPSRGGSTNNGTADLTLCSITDAAGTASGSWTTSLLTISGSSGHSAARSYTISFNTSSANYIENVFSSDPQVQTSGQNNVEVYLYKNYKYWQSSQSTILNSTASSSLSSGSLSFNGTDYASAYTPYLQSQLISDARYDLFQIYTRSDGEDVNKKYNIIVSDIKAAGEVPGSSYGSFSLQVRSVDQLTFKQSDETIVEQWDNLNLDPESPNFFARVIGDRYVTISSVGKLTYNGDWPNKSKHIYVKNYTAISEASVPVTVVPMGFKAMSNVEPTTTSAPTGSFKRGQLNSRDEFDSNVYYGYDFENLDNREYLAPVPSSAGVGSNVSMSLENMFGNDDASTLGTTYADSSTLITLSNSHIKQRKFGTAFQGGFNGDNPAAPKFVGTNITAANVMGYDCSTSTTSGSVAFKRAINAVSNQDEFDINLLAIPGVNHRLHPVVTNHAISMVEDRGDALYIMDSAHLSDSIDTVTDTVNALDTSYAATYYPWTKIADRNTGLPVWVDPSVVLPGVIAYTDKVAHEWFAPAGLNRGGLTTVLEAKTRLTHAERDDLYEGRVNPIASFPGQGVVVWGQKTLQAKPSALDRVNVRRLLIKLKKFIASSSRYLVFEQNVSATRTRFLNIVNPFLESVQQNSGLTAFRVVMDETNNTAEVIDRNRLVGQIFISPARTGEFIVLDFVVMPTGASFPS